MTPSDNPSSNTANPFAEASGRKAGLVLRIVLPLALLVLGIIGYNKLSVEIPEEAQPRRERKPVETRVLELKREDYQVKIPSQGNVRAHGLVNLTAEVAGKVQAIHPPFEEGAFFAKGDILLEINPIDLQVALISAQAQVASAQLNLEKEEALAEQARLDWKDLGYEDEPSALVRREPQLKAARQGLLLAEAQEQSALRNLERTKVTAPFDGRVLRRTVGVGQSIGPSTSLAEIFATDYSEVRLPLSTLNLRDITLPEDASDPPLVVTLRDGLDDQSSTEWSARILRTEGALDANTLELFAIARIEDPFGLQSEQPPLRVGQPVIASIPGKTLEDVFVIPREAVSQLSRIRIVDPTTMKLDSSYIRPLHSDDDHIIFRDSSLEDGTLLVLTRLVYAPDGGGVIIIPEENEEVPDNSPSTEVTSPPGDKGASGSPKP
ncbi:MAG TPA: efflux RND transporter periplasmic adaptor subunit [Verrucomicrobiales bacterium]|nr:efflux RND transporter periplasmic adaptor subunit [Verrucomicrobiales bacterium]